MPLEVRWGQNVGLRDFCYILTSLLPGASLFLKHMCCSVKETLTLIWRINDKSWVFGMHDPFPKYFQFAPCHDILQGIRLSTLLPWKALVFYQHLLLITGILWRGTGCTTGVVWWSAGPCAEDRQDIPPAPGSRSDDRGQRGGEDNSVQICGVDERTQYLPDQGAQ